MMVTQHQFVITPDGTQIAYADQGQGDPVLLIHGFPDSMVVWRHQVPALLDAGFRVIQIDLRGYGHSDVPKRSRDYKMLTVVDDVRVLLDHLGLKTVKVVGHDWGALIGWLLCLVHPERVDRFLAASLGHPTAYALSGIKQKLSGWYVVFFQLRGLSETMLKASNWRMLRHFTGSPPDFDNTLISLSRPGRLTAAINYYRTNLWDLLLKRWPQATVPVRGIWGRHDDALLEQQMRDTARYVKRPWEYTILDGRHWIQLEQPEAFNAAMLNYLQLPRTTLA